MIDFIVSNLNVLGLISKDCSVLGADTKEVLKDVYTAIRIAVPALVILLCSVDMIKAVIAQDDKEMQAALQKSIKRIAIGLAIFFIPTILDVILDLVGIAAGTCSIGG